MKAVNFRAHTLILGLSIVGLIGLGDALGYVHQRVPFAPPADAPLSWPKTRGQDGFPVSSAFNNQTGAIIFRWDDDGFETGDLDAERNALRAAFDQWESIPGSGLRFEEGPRLRGANDVEIGDGKNALIILRDSPIYAEGTRDASGLLGETVLSFDAEGRIVEADIVFNAVEFNWVARRKDARDGLFSIEQVALHEIGHLLGLDHSPLGAATMAFETGDGATTWSQLSTDEIAFVRAVYPDPDAGIATAGLRGRVTTSGGLPVEAAAVYLENPKGVVVAGTVSEVDGAYEIHGVAPDTYSVWLGPLDAPTVDRARSLRLPWEIGTRFGTLEFGYQSFATTESVAPISLGASGVHELNLTAQGTPTAFRVTGWQGPDNAMGGPLFPRRFGVHATQGTQGRFLKVFGLDFPATGLQLEVSGSGVRVGELTVTDNALGIIDVAEGALEIEGDAVAGMRRITLSDAAGASVSVFGYLEALPAISDANFDGLDDGFQRQYFAPFTASDAAPDADPDGDGADNAWEARRGTDPTDKSALDFGILSVRLDAEGALVTWESFPGKRYRLQRKRSVGAGDWERVVRSVAAEGPTTSYRDTEATEEIFFYRVLQLD